MQQEKLTELKELEYYRKLHRRRTATIIIFSIVFFLIGFITGKVVYEDLPRDFQPPVKVSKP